MSEKIQTVFENVICAWRDDGSIAVIANYGGIIDLLEDTHEALEEDFACWINERPTIEDQSIFSCTVDMNPVSSYDYYSGGTEWDWRPIIGNIIPLYKINQ